MASTGQEVQTTTVAISKDSDLTITVKSRDKDKLNTGVFHVKTESVSTKSKFFRGSIRFKTSSNDVGLVLHDDDIDAMRIWLTLMHSSEDIAPGSDLTPRLGAIDITTIWHVINAGDKYLFSDDEELADPAREFFKLWYAQNVDLDSFTPDLATTTFARQLALPCHFFDHPEAFAAITKWLAYNCVGHIQESVPVKFKFVHLHLCPPDFVGPVNHARGSLKTTLHRGLWNRVGDLLKKGSNGIACAHWAETAGRYFGALTKLEVYPLELSFSKNSINTLLGWLGDFHLNNKIIGCYSCKADWNREVKSAVYRTRGHFDGLCIDCMDKSKIKNGRNDEDYWEKLGAVDGRFDKDCRIRHADNTWWVSWCGRDEHRRKLMDEKRAQERQE